MRIMILIFVLAGFVLLAMRSMAQVNLCLLPLEERPDYCTGNAPTVTPVATAAAQPPPELDTYPAPLPYPNAEEQHSPQSNCV